MRNIIEDGRYRFKVLDGIVSSHLNELPNLSKIGEGHYECDCCDTLRYLDSIGFVRVEWDRTHPGFYDTCEMVEVNGEYKFAKPNATQIELIEAGIFKCLKCGHDMKVPQVPGKKERQPFICESETCARKGPFERISPKLIKPLWRLSGEPIPCTPSELFSEIRDYWVEHIAFTDDRFYDIDSALTMSTYVHENMITYPYRFYLGPKRTGKTRALEILQELCYRGRKSSTISPPSVYRFIELYHPTLLIDEGEFQLNLKYEHGRILYSILNSGYKRGDLAIRTAEDGSVEGFDVFGFKAISATKSLLSTLEDRCIITNTEEGKPKKRRVDEDWARQIRSKLLWFRFKYTNKIIPSVGTLDSGRLDELFSPIFTIVEIVGTNTKPIHSFASEMEKEWKEEEKLTLDSTIVQVIADALSERPKEISLVGGSENTVLKIPVSEIASRVNEYLESEEPVSSGSIGWALKRLGIKKKHGKKGRYIDVEDFGKKLERLKVKYGIK